MTDAPRPPHDPPPSDDAHAPTRVMTGRGREDFQSQPAAGAATTVAAAAPAPARAPAPLVDAGTLPPGSRMAEFEITHLIGQGGFGAVYEAWDHTLERTVAIKEYLPTSLSTRGGDGTVTPLSDKHRETFELGMRSFINEARLLAQFDHPSLLKVYRFWEDNGTTYMVMPLYRGQTLRQTLADKPNVDEGWLLRIMDGVTQALAVMHNANCYHRDIAPDNILLLEGTGKPVVLDFGAARRVISDKTQAITVILKPGYAPVEQYAEMPDMTQGAWTDVYALAAVMHVAVCGRAPPPSVARIMSDTYVPLAGNELLRQRYSQRLLETIDHGLAVRPEQRPQSMLELRAELGLEETTTIAPLRAAGPRTVPGAHGARAPASPPRPAAGSGPAAAPAPRSKALAGALIGVAGVALLAGGAWWWMQGRAPADAPAPAVAQAPVAAPVDVAPAPPPPAPPPPPPVRRTPLQSLQALGASATPGFTVQASAVKPEVEVGKDKLGFELRSNREGYVYVYLLASGGEMFMLFPNLLDKYNKINANQTLTLPRASWPMNAGGPPGTNHFAVVVSQHERDFSEAGMQTDGVFPQFPLPVLSALEAASPGKPTPLLGKPQCPPGQACTDAFGVAGFKIVER
ncbi:serine/threonine-protein kinase [Xenophilus arseniciresistens]|uniref:Serine/threonine-protein kinase n=1 Tax=Xenophilus arseniciresistens TaxID=1283306 RepID=A0AAE3NFM0_9BURK|nr:serine/threonine-protein kinase [Xenophilus arseniciresistens]MDA7418754.1 serine/threonine-protein kinase [Xenophilus arseniciresistens]